MKTITICGGGSLGHVIAGWLSANGKAKVNIYTKRSSLWSTSIKIDTPKGTLLTGKIEKITDKPSEVIPQSDVVLLCVPGPLITEEIEAIKNHLSPHTYVGGVFASSGFFFEAKKSLSPAQPLWGFQRVPFIARVAEYGKSAHLLGYRNSYHIAIENVTNEEKQEFVRLMEDWFERPVTLLNNYLEASITNSNPILHTSRLYTMFGGENEGKIFPKMILFYEEWTVEAAQLLIEMDRELFALLKKLPVSEGYLIPILDYYESKDAPSMASKLCSISGLKNITSPMIQTEKGWIPDYNSRYFTEDFSCGLKYIWELAHEYSVECPNIDKVFAWGISKINK